MTAYKLYDKVYLIPHSRVAEIVGYEGSGLFGDWRTRLQVRFLDAPADEVEWIDERDVLPPIRLEAESA